MLVRQECGCAKSREHRAHCWESLRVLRCDELSVEHEIGCGGVSPECNDVQLGSAAKDGSLLFFKPALNTLRSRRELGSAHCREDQSVVPKKTPSRIKKQRAGALRYGSSAGGKKEREEGDKIAKKMLELRDAVDFD